MRTDRIWVLIIGCLVVLILGIGFAHPLDPKHRQSEQLIIQRMIQAYLDGALAPTCEQLPGMAIYLRERLQVMLFADLHQKIQSLEWVAIIDFRLALLQVVADPATTQADIFGLTRVCQQRVLETIPACEDENLGDFRCYRMASRR